MVAGLDVFKEHFQDYADRYVLIGGTACDLVMDEIGLSFRTTKDLDIVLCVGVLDADFAAVFWEFVKKGEYCNREKATGGRTVLSVLQPGVRGVSRDAGTLLPCPGCSGYW